jgi:ribosomal protein L32
MWVRVTCPNGHRVKIETRYLGRENRCPRCQAHVYLWIQVVCPNGHTLRVQSKYAGRVGTCPECKQTVMVPDLTEVIAMETLGDSVLGVDAAVDHDAELAVSDSASLAAATEETSTAESSIVEQQPKTPMRECKHCKAKIAKGLRTCPNCGKYLGDADALERPASAVKCPQCGATSFPGDTFCSSCGSPLE